jgi:hypothetical protein
VPAGKDALKHAGGLYRRLYRAALRPIRGAEHEAHHLHEIEQEGESGATPLIAILGLLLFLGSIFIVLLGLALLAYNLAS